MIKITKLNTPVQLPCGCDPGQHEPQCAEAPWNKEQPVVVRQKIKAVTPVEASVPFVSPYYEPKPDNTPIRMRRIWP